MNVIRSVVLLITIFTVTFAYPANDQVNSDKTSTAKSEERPPPVDSEIDFVQRPDAPFPQNGVVDIDANPGGFFGNPFYDNPFPSIFESFNALMYRMRQHLNQLLGRAPERRGDSPFPELHIPNVSNIDLGKGNTTSVTKIIDGHKVTINETEYKQEGDNGGSYFKVRVIDVHPDSAETTDKPLDKPTNDKESVEYTDTNNEIPKVKDNEGLKRTDIEMFSEVDGSHAHHSTHIRSNGRWGNNKPLESIEDNSINSELLPPPDLSNDIYVNQLLMDSGAPTNPDAEVFDVLNGQLVPQVPRKTVALNYLPAQKDSLNTNKPASDFARVGFHPTYTNNMQFLPQPIYPMGNPIPNFLPPNDFYVRPPNFPMFQSNFPNNQMYFSQHVPVEQNFPPTPNVDQHQQSYSHSTAELQKSTQINENELSTNNVPVSTDTGANPATT